MEKDILELIEESMQSFSAKQRIVAMAVLQDPLSATFLSIQELSDRIHVSPATIVRFAQTVTGEGYPELQEALHKHIQEESNPLKRMELNVTVNSKDDEFIARTHATLLDNLQKTFTQDLLNSLQKAVDLLFSARHVYAVGARASYSIAYFLGQHLNRAFNNADIFSDDDKLADNIMRTQRGDVVIYVCAPRYSRRLVAAAQLLNEKGVHIITINDSLNSPFIKFSEISFIAPCTSSDYHNSLIAPMLIADLLISLIIRKDSNSTISNLSNYEPYFKALDQFYNQ